MSNGSNSLSLFEKPFSVMGIVNVTPDSFSDGGRYFQTSDAVDHAFNCIKNGADVIDIGGESTRPGAKEVPIESEIARVVPVIKEIKKRSAITISIDTRKAPVAEAALQAGAHWINDVSAGRFDPSIIECAKKYNRPVILMHSRKKPDTMQIDTRYANPVEEVFSELKNSIDRWVSAGFPQSKIIVDPGIGFAKDFKDNFEIIQNIERIKDLRCPLLLGVSRKSFIGTLTKTENINHRTYGSLAVAGRAWLKGVRMFRVHDVLETVAFLKGFTAFH